MYQKLKPYNFHLFFGLSFGIILFIWLKFAVFKIIPFWQITGDYNWDSFSRALTWESRAAGFPATHFNEQIHPGLPYSILSWLALRFSTLWIPDSVDRINFAINHIESYWMWAKLFALTLNFAALCVLARMYKQEGWLFFLAFGIYFAMTPDTMESSLIQLKNDTFAFPYATLFYFLAYQLLTATEEKNRVILSIGLAFLAVFGVSIKIYYLAPLAGLAFGLITAMIVRSINVKTGIKISVILAISFLSLGFVVVYFIFGWDVFKQWVAWNWSMLSHTDVYGTGSQGFSSYAYMQESYNQLRNHTKNIFPLILIFLIVLTSVTLIKQWNNKIWRNKNFPFIVAVFVGIAINMIGLLKHYQSYYALIVCASLSSLLLVFKSSHDIFLSKFIKLTMCFFILVLIIINFKNYSYLHYQHRHWASANIRDMIRVEHLPLKTGEKRVWGYFSPTKAGIIPWISRMTGSTFIAQILRKEGNMVDILPLEELDAKHWKYIVLPKTQFPTLESIKTNYLKQNDFVPTAFKIQKTDRITDLETFFLLTRN